MKNNRNSFILFAIAFTAVMLFLFTTEQYNETMTLPNRKIDYSEIEFDVSDIFEKDEVAEFASEMFEYQGIRSGIVDIATTGFTKEDLGVNDSVVYITEVILENGSQVSFIEPDTEAVDMYNNISSESLLVVIVKDKEGVKYIIREDDEDFERYKQALLKEKRSIQITKLTNLEMLLSESLLIGKYNAYLGSEENWIRGSSIYLNENKNYMLMLSKDKLGVEYFLVDADVDMYFDHIYELGTEFLEVKGYVTSNDLDHLMYRSFIKMIELDTDYFEAKFKEDLLIIKRDRSNDD